MIAMFPFATMLSILSACNKQMLNASHDDFREKKNP